MAKRVYIADYRDLSGKRRRTSHATRAEADLVESRARAAIAERDAKKFRKIEAKAEGIIEAIAASQEAR